MLLDRIQEYKDSEINNSTHHQIESALNFLVNVILLLLYPNV
jgi:hypothetical protein